MPGTAAMNSPQAAGDRWRGFLTAYHRDHAGITETLLDRATRPGVGTPYDWLRSGVPGKPDRVVDLACGSAPMNRYFAQPTDYLGIDVSRGELEVALARRRGPLVEANILDLPLPDSCTDVVICSMAIMLLEPIERALSEIARVLRPGGRFISTRPVTWPIRVRDVRVGVELFRGLRQMPELPQRFTRSGLSRLQASVGLSVTEDRALRFTHPLHDASDAACIVEGLYLPTVDPNHRRAAVERLSNLAGPTRAVPVSIRRTVAIRSISRCPS